MPFEIISITDYGIAIQTHIRLKEGDLYELSSVFLEELNIPYTPLRIHSVQPEENGFFKTRLSFTKLTDIDRKKIRDWIRAQKQVA